MLLFYFPGISTRPAPIISGSGPVTFVIKQAPTERMRQTLLTNMKSRKHKPLKLFTCSICQKGLNSRDQLKVHM